MKKRKLNYRFHDPNPAGSTADYILKMFIDANQEKVEQAIQNAAEATAALPTCPTELETIESHSA